MIVTPPNVASYLAMPEIVSQGISGIEGREVQSVFSAAQQARSNRG
jgi:hypothetical protein